VVFIPVSDDNPLRSIHLQWVTISLIAANVIVFVLGKYHNTEPAALASFALVPAEFFGGGTPVPGQAFQVPEVLTLVTYQFMHVDVLHLASNMLFLWVFGDNVEDAMGHLRFLMFYLLSGVAGGMAHAALWPASASPLIGASGAVAGVIAAYLMLHPRVRVWVLAFRFIPLRIAGGLGARRLGRHADRDGVSGPDGAPHRLVGPMSAAWGLAPSWSCFCAGAGSRCSIVDCRRPPPSRSLPPPRYKGWSAQSLSKMVTGLPN